MRDRRPYELHIRDKLKYTSESEKKNYKREPIKFNSEL